MQNTNDKMHSVYVNGELSKKRSCRNEKGSIFGGDDCSILISNFSSDVRYIVKYREGIGKKDNTIKIIKGSK